MGYVIINVDDFGLNPAVNRAVSELSHIGKISSTTVIANAPFMKEAAELKNIGIGVHLNILRGNPLSNPDKIGSVVDENGLLLGNYSKLLKRYILRKIDLKHVEIEWRMQIEKILDNNIKPTHFDSEKHIHAWPKLMSLALKLAEKYKIKWVRRPYEKTGLFRFDTGALRTRFLNSCCFFHKNRTNVKWPDYVWGIADQGDSLLPELFKSYFKRLSRKNIIEIVCHPGNPKDDDPKIPSEFGNLRIYRQWMKEYNLLKNLDWGSCFNHLGLKLVNYSDIQ
jgi:predicted glycoside hydrolase/deacetylase ChbG (UPF0249 family)